MEGQAWYCKLLTITLSRAIARILHGMTETIHPYACLSEMWMNEKPMTLSSHARAAPSYQSTSSNTKVMFVLDVKTVFYICVFLELM